METLYILRGTEIKREDNTLVVVTEDKKKRRFPVESLRHVVVLGATRLNSEIAVLLGKSRVRVSFLDYYGNFAGALEPSQYHDSGSVHLAQARIILDEPQRLAMAWRILETGGLNMIRNLKYYIYRGCQALRPHIREMEDHLQRGKKAKTIEEMMGNEGLARQTYYAGWREISPALAITKRTKRPPADRINALISFCNGLVYSTCAHAIAQTHLDRTLSFVHAPTQARNSLALDLAEIFKPIIADRMIFWMVNKRILDDGCYEEHPGVCLLSRNGRERVLDEFRERMDNTRIGEEVGWRRIMVKEAFAVEAHVLGLAEYEPFVLKA